jgi:hypothetical protein
MIFNTRSTLQQSPNELETANRQISNRPPHRGRSTPPQKRKRKDNSNTAADQREEARGEESRGDKMQANAKTLGDVRPSAAVADPGQQRATQEMNERTNETWLFLHQYWRWNSKGTFVLAGCNGHGRTRKADLQGREADHMHGWMDGWMTLEIGRR